jgi:hypothetical protein
MTNNLPDYTSIEPPDETPITEYSTHERRAALLRRIKAAGSPFAITQSREAERFDVHRSTISRDMDRLRESVDEQLGQNAKLTTRVLFESVVTELLEADDWRAKKAAWGVVRDWNDWLADLGEQHREPRQSEVDVDVRREELAYTVVREGDDALPTTDDGDGADDGVDYEALGFSSAPVAVDVEESSEAASDE